MNAWLVHRVNRLRICCLVLAVALIGCGSPLPASPLLPSDSARPANTVPGSPAPPPSPLPSRSPSPAQSPPIAVSPSPSPTESPSPTPTPAPSPTPLFPATALKSAHGHGFSAVYGPLVFGGRSVIDLTTGQSRSLANMTFGGGPYEEVATPDRLVWTYTPHWQRTTRIPPSDLIPGPRYRGPVPWRIAAVDLATGVRSDVATGTNRQLTDAGEGGPYVREEVLAASGTRVAYAVEAATSRHPFRHLIVVRSLLDGAVIRTVSTNGMVDELAMDGEAIAYRDCSQTMRDPGLGRVVETESCPLMLVRDDLAKPVQVDAHVRRLAMNAGWLAWQRVDVDPQGLESELMLAMDVGARIPIAVEPPLDPVTGRPMELIFEFTVGNGLVAMAVADPDGDVVAPALALWTPASGGSRLADGQSSVEGVRIAGSWLTWSSFAGDIFGIPLDQLQVQ